MTRAKRGRLQALLDEWRSELVRKPLGMTESDACAVLGLEPKDGEQVAPPSLSSVFACQGPPPH